ncbi:MAG: DUF5818 domain-containing protein [Terracidiphilus sp.]
MRSIKSDLIEFCSLCAVTFVFALVLGTPLIAAGLVFAEGQDRSPRQPERNQDRAATFAGTVVKDGEQYDLRDSSGEVFKLDDAERAKPFAGKAVKVTGELDVQARVIHVESIEGAEG